MITLRRASVQKATSGPSHDVRSARFPRRVARRRARTQSTDYRTVLTVSKLSQESTTDVERTQAPQAMGPTGRLVRPCERLVLTPPAAQRCYAACTPVSSTATRGLSSRVAR